MVTGIDKFKEYFAEYENNYIIIGGTACDILEENAGQIPRATKDIDIILIVEAVLGVRQSGQLLHPPTRKWGE